MRVIDFAPPEPEASALDNLLSRAREMLNLGDSGLKAQESIITRLKRGLDNRFTLLRNVPLEGLDVPIPMILAGPAGVYVLHVSGDKGVYQAKEESWYEIGGATRRFQPARRNLIKIAMLLGRTVDAYLTKSEILHPEVQPVLIFAHPGVHVDTNRPAVRIVLMDAVERFITDLIRASDTLMPGDVRAIVETLEKAEPRVVAPPDKQEITAERQAPSEPREPTWLDNRLDSLAETEIPLPPALANLRFSRGQWILLGAFAVFEICFLMVFIIYVIMTAV